MNPAHHLTRSFLPLPCSTSRYGEGEGYAVNVPLNDGMDDEMYIRVFKEVVMKVMERFAPSAVVFQSGADSLAGAFMLRTVTLHMMRIRLTTLI